ncbi:flagellar type III secretion system pore protein FliP [Vallitalea okinawensis]|uniref:flagellar type III secretion system pore protein FliP n=1 Tax=Vallitalea okinawensis TaxID=2078660 RepID=UPI000CFE2678|nr:flagellar type III secretion system pore protein FliP [Vallitalea okinawensis]
MKTIKSKRLLIVGILFLTVLFLGNSYVMEVHATEAVDSLMEVTINSGDDQSVIPSLQMLFLLTIIALIPAILVTTTSFTRIIIVLSFVRSALGVQQSPPNQVLIGLALFLTLFVMGPTLSEINENAFQPYTEGVISQEEVMERSIEPMREFMFSQVGADELALFSDIAGIEVLEPTAYDGYPTREELPTTVLIPAFIISEIKTAFILGFIIYVPFIVIDMVVASTLMSMGMMMLPPVMISLPFKILLFILVDGWGLVIGELMKTFQ